VLRRLDSGGHESGETAHGNVCALPTSAVDLCDTPSTRVWSSTVDEREGEPQVHPVWDALGCCPNLAVGDVIFYREDVYHRTQDELVDRLGMVVTIDARSPSVETLEDVRCADWAADGLCTAEPFGMGCLCRRACEEWAASAPPTLASTGPRVGELASHDEF